LTVLLGHTTVVLDAGEPRVRALST
jgi:hypothetical protein